MTDDPLRDRFRGTLLGLFCGDALGMPFEGWPLEAIRRTHGAVTEMQEARLGAGTFTDDTQMALALAEALADGPADAPDLDRVATCFAERFEPRRGYGGNAQRVLAAIRSGRPWRDVVVEHRLPGGSWANGAAMRVAPVALAFFPDRELVGRGAEEQARVTGHDHPVGRFGARLLALAVLEALRSGAVGRDFPAESFLERVADDAPDDFRAPLRWIAEHPGAEDAAAVRSLGVGLRASESVPAALWAFLSRRHEPERAISRAVGLGGDTDTIGAMAGALAGAFCGENALPSRWLERLEEAAREECRRLGDQLRSRTDGDRPRTPSPG